MEKFKENVLKLAKKLSALRVPAAEGESKEPLLIWTTTPPCECDVPIIGEELHISCWLITDFHLQWDMTNK